MTALTVAPVRKDDIHDLMDVAASCSLGYWSEKDLDKTLEKEHSIVLGSYGPAGQLTGFISGRIAERPDQPAEIFNIGVRPHSQGQGYGSLLLDAFIKKSIDSQANEIWLEVRDSNQTAIQFYKNKGFTVVGQRKNFYIAPVEDAILMTLKLPVTDAVDA